MGFFERLQLSATTSAHIEWDITPDLAFCTYSAKGLREGLDSSRERICYFFIDNWGEEPKLYLMERGARYVNILAEIKAPRELLLATIANVGPTSTGKGNFPIDGTLKEWLLHNVVEVDDSPYLLPTGSDKDGAPEEEAALPPVGSYTGPGTPLPPEPSPLTDNGLPQLLAQWNFFDGRRNPAGGFGNALTAESDRRVTIDEKTGLMWQRGGLDLCSFNRMKQRIAELNADGLAGFHDWRLPTLEEAMSLLTPLVNPRGQHVAPCFSGEQPFVFTTTRRVPTGYWLVDYARGYAYWSSGTSPGGFARLCRRV